MDSTGRTLPLGGSGRRTSRPSRHDVARVLARLRADLAGTDDPVEKAVNAAREDFGEVVVRLITAGRTTGALPPGPPAQVVANAYMGAMHGVVDHLGAQAPFDALFAERATSGVLGLPPTSETGNPSSGNGRL